MDTKISQACADRQSSRPPEGHVVGGGAGQQVVGARTERADGSCAYAGPIGCDDDRCEGGTDIQGGDELSYTAGIPGVAGISMGRQFLGGRLLCGDCWGGPRGGDTTIHQGTAQARPEHAEGLIPRAFSPGSGFMRIKTA